jgi:hypothetical protein
MKYKLVSVAFALLFGALSLVLGQAPATNGSPKGLVTTPPAGKKPQNLSHVQIQDVTSTANGVNVVMLASHVAMLYFAIDRPDPNSTTTIEVISGLTVNKVPEEIRGDYDATGTVTLPILLDPKLSSSYVLTTWAKSENNEDMDWGTYAGPRKFDAYMTPKTPPPPVFKLEFGPKDLTVSADTGDKIAKLSAVWQAGDKVVDSASTTKPNPSVPLSFDNLKSSATGQNFPALALSLEDQTTHETQQASIQLAVASSQAVSSKVSNATNNPAQQSKTKFSWADLASTGIGAILKYFLGAI